MIIYFGYVCELICRPHWSSGTLKDLRLAGYIDIRQGIVVIKKLLPTSTQREEKKDKTKILWDQTAAKLHIDKRQ